MSDGRDSSESQTWPRGPLYRPMLKQLCLEMGELTGELDRIRAGMESGSTSAFEDLPLLRLGRETGWILGLLAAVNGADLFLERRAPFALPMLLERVQSLLKNFQIELPPSNRELAPFESGPPGWELPWAVANALYAGALNRCSQTGPWHFLKADSLYVLSGYWTAGKALADFALELESGPVRATYHQEPGRWSMKFGQTETA